MMHLCAFRNPTSVNNGAAVFSTLPAVIDSFLTTNANNRFIIPALPISVADNWRVLAGIAFGTTMTHARVFSSYIQRVFRPSLVPINPGLTIPNLFPIEWMGRRGPVMAVNDEFSIEADAGAIEVQTGFLWIGDGNANVPSGETFTAEFLAVNGGSTTTAVLTGGVWSQCNIQFLQPLPPGKYAVIGGDVMTVTGFAWRLVPPNAGPRPGGLARATLAIFPSGLFMNGDTGTLMEFAFNAQPTIEIFVGATATQAAQGYLNLVKIG